ncbi:hypothetical protein [Paenibacillus campi]|uniref:hypothetical protein n=1 Tax=Paenibacillus campi TaxID=3106031 RepID=UPI002AFE8570|nr:hypothetical protein [Paenibacillus sp. SGZ-1014]
MLVVIGFLLVVAFVVLIVMYAATRKKNQNRSFKMFLAGWGCFILGMVLIFASPNEPEKAKQEAAQPSTETKVAETSTDQASATETTTNETKKQSDDQQAAASKTETASEPVKATEGKETIYVETKQSLDKQVVLDYVANIRGRSFLKNVTVGQQDISIAFHSNYKEYKAANPQSGITETDYIEYFSTGDEINKILMEESTRLLKEFPAANEIKMTLPFEGKTYSVDLTKEAAEKFYNGIDFDTLKANGGWGQISNKYFNDTDRQRFAQEFIKVQ